jgi:hypothetical protein
LSSRKVIVPVVKLEGKFTKRLVTITVPEVLASVAVTSKTTSPAAIVSSIVIIDAAAKSSAPALPTPTTLAFSLKVTSLSIFNVVASTISPNIASAFAAT